VQYVNAPVIACGNIHGQLHNLIEIFDICGDIHHTSYLFLGDYIHYG
jgi:hypothetical protein